VIDLNLFPSHQLHLYELVIFHPVTSKLSLYSKFVTDHEDH